MTSPASVPLHRRPRPARVAGALSLASLMVLGACAPNPDRVTSRSLAPAVACPTDPDPSVTSTIRIGYQHIPNGDLIVKDAGLLETCLPNATIEWSQFSSGGDVIQAFGARSLDVGSLGSSPAAKALSQPLNIDMQVIWVHDVIGGAESLAAKDPQIKVIEDLAGKSIGVPFSSTAHYSLLAALERAGIEGEVDVVDLKPDAILAAWRNDQIDAAWIWQPMLGQLLDVGHVIMSGADTAEAGAPTYDLAGATREFAEANPDALHMWAVVQDWAVAMLNDDPEGAAARIAAELGTPVDDVAKQLEGYTFLRADEQDGADYLGGGLADDLEGTARFLLSQGEIGALSPKDTYLGAIRPTDVEETSR